MKKEVLLSLHYFQWIPSAEERLLYVGSFFDPCMAREHDLAASVGLSKVPEILNPLGCSISMENSALGLVQLSLLMSDQRSEASFMLVATLSS